MIPSAGEEFSRGTAWHNNRVAARQTNLPAVGVAAQNQLESSSGGSGESLGAVREEDRTLVGRDSRPDFCEVVGFVEMRIVDAGDPKSLSVPLQKRRLVEQNRKADFFEPWNHLEKVVVAEDSETGRGQRGANPPHLLQATGGVSLHAVAKISRQDSRIVGRGAHQIFHHRSQCGL